VPERLQDMLHQRKLVNLETAHKMDINLFDTSQRRFGDVQLVLY
jgi:hypothetical protein